MQNNQNNGRMYISRNMCDMLEFNPHSKVQPTFRSSARVQEFSPHSGIQPAFRNSARIQEFNPHLIREFLHEYKNFTVVEKNSTTMIVGHCKEVKELKNCLGEESTDSREMDIKKPIIFAMKFSIKTRLNKLFRSIFSSFSINIFQSKQ